MSVRARASTVKCDGNAGATVQCRSRATTRHATPRRRAPSDPAHAPHQMARRGKSRMPKNNDTAPKQATEYSCGWMRRAIQNRTRTPMILHACVRACVCALAPLLNAAALLHHRTLVASESARSSEARRRAPRTARCTGAARARITAPRSRARVSSRVAKPTRCARVPRSP
jgi:hypothetical protein